MDTSDQRAVSRRHLLKSAGAMGAMAAAASVPAPSSGVAVWASVLASIKARPILVDEDAKAVQIVMDRARSLGWEVTDRLYSATDWSQVIVRKEMPEAEAERIERAWQNDEFSEKTPIIGQLGDVCGLWIEKAAR